MIIKEITKPKNVYILGAIPNSVYESNIGVKFGIKDDYTGFTVSNGLDSCDVMSEGACIILTEVEWQAVKHVFDEELYNYDGEDYALVLKDYIGEIILKVYDENIEIDFTLEDGDITTNYDNYVDAWLIVKTDQVLEAITINDLLGKDE